MAKKEDRYKKSIAGKFYTTDPDSEDGEGCVACGVCFTNAPEFFDDDDEGYAYVHKQPSTESEISLCMEQLAECPVESIGNDGDS